MPDAYRRPLDTFNRPERDAYEAARIALLRSQDASMDYVFRLRVKDLEILLGVVDRLIPVK